MATLSFTRDVHFAALALRLRLSSWSRLTGAIPRADERDMARHGMRQTRVQESLTLLKFCLLEPGMYPSYRRDHLL